MPSFLKADAAPNDSSAAGAAAAALGAKGPTSPATPMMRQYLEIKSQYPDAILLYRLGDFYEMFLDDAVVASRVLDLTLTSRNKNQEGAVPLCGVPYHAVDGYIARLIAAGRKVAVCEQVEDPREAKGIVRREVTRVISPGTVFEDASLKPNANNFLLCLCPAAAGFTVAVCDVSTGRLEFFGVGGLDGVLEEIQRYAVREVIYPEALLKVPAVMAMLSASAGLYHHAQPDLYFDAGYARDLLLSTFSVTDLHGLGLSDTTPPIEALGGVLGYLKGARLLKPQLLSQPHERSSSSHLGLDETTFRNLEIFSTLGEGARHGSLLGHLDTCQTAMGSRLIAEWLRRPLRDLEKIRQRQGAVENILSDAGFLDEVSDLLSGMADLERLTNRFVGQNPNARDAVALKNGLAVLPALKTRVGSRNDGHLQELAHAIQLFAELYATIKTTLVDDPPQAVREGGMIQKGVNAELDELRRLEGDGKSVILAMEARERETTGIASLKIRYHNVFGYTIEITNAHKERVPSSYIRKQTLVSAERYITEELKELESRVLGAAERIKTIEYGIFQGLKDLVEAHGLAIKNTAATVAAIDALCALARVARKFNYVKPDLDNSRVFLIRSGRHPVLEGLHLSERQVPNDIELDGEGSCQMIITGPNMAGKSTLMRMAALIAVMAHTGSFVPATAARIGLCDRVFTRVGAHDQLQKGQSTFMVEMVETAKILREATPLSLIILDEIGRGTSTFDGLSIAWAVAEDLHDRLRARTFFATHYHELCDLAGHKPGVCNFHLAVKEWNNQIIFLRRLRPGGTNRSYGVVVAGMAGLPPSVIARAKEVLKLLELKDLSFDGEIDPQDVAQMSLFQPAVSAIMKPEESAVIHAMQGLDVDKLTPIEALNWLAASKQKLVQG